MKRVFLILSIIGYVVCIGWALLPALTPFWFTEAYFGMCFFALVALFSGKTEHRWFFIVAIVAGLIGAFVSVRHNTQVRARIDNAAKQAASRAAQDSDKQHTNDTSNALGKRP